MSRPQSWKDLTANPVHRIAAVSKMHDLSNEKDGTSIVFRASTPVKDRDDERISVPGWFWRETLPNQFYNHDPKLAANWIGKGARVWKDDEALYYQTILFDKSPTETADLARQMAWIAEKHPECLTSSVGFSPRKWRDPNGQVCTIDDPRGSRPWTTPGREYLEQELLENSVAPVASNYEALAVQVRSLGGIFGEPPHENETPDLIALLEKALLDGDLSPDTLIEKAALAGVVLEQLDRDLYEFGIRKTVSRPQQKAGAVLSRANLERVSNAIASLDALRTELDALVASAKPAEQAV